MDQFESLTEERWLPNVTVEKTEAVGNVSTKITVDISGYYANDVANIMCEFLKSVNRGEYQ